MTHIRIKRVYEQVLPGDGFRVLVDKLWPRGIRRATLPLDLWAKELAPSDELRRWYHADPAGRWKEFSRRYGLELHASAAVRQFLRDLAGKDTVTLLYASRNPAENHALVLREYLEHALAAMPQDVTTA